MVEEPIGKMDKQVPCVQTIALSVGMAHTHTRTAPRWFLRRHQKNANRLKGFPYSTHFRTPTKRIPPEQTLQAPQKKARLTRISGSKEVLSVRLESEGKSVKEPGRIDSAHLEPLFLGAGLDAVCQPRPGIRDHSLGVKVNRLHPLGFLKSGKSACCL